MTIYSQTGYCACGQEIWIEYLWTGSQWQARFTVDDHTEVETCPACGAALDAEELESI